MWPDLNWQPRPVNEKKQEKQNTKRREHRFATVEYWATFNCSMVIGPREISTDLTYTVRDHIISNNEIVRWF